MQKPRDETATNILQNLIEGLTDNFGPIFDKLAGTQSELKLGFEDLMVDTGTVKAKMSGQIILSAIYSEQQYSQPKIKAQEPKTSDKNQVSQTVVTDITL